MAKKKVAGPGRLGSVKAVKKSLKGGGQKGIKTISAEDSITVRFLDDLEDFHGYYEHWMTDGPLPCSTDDCDGCQSDDEDERRKGFKYLANAYVVDDQKVWALKMPKTLVEMLTTFHTKYKGTLLDRDYELSRTGSGQYDTKYFAAPDEKSKMDLSRFERKKYNLTELLSDLVNGEDDDEDEDEDDEPRPKKKKKSGPKKSKDNPWNDDEDDEPVRRPKKKKSSASSRPVKKSAVRRPVKKTVKRSR